MSIREEIQTAIEAVSMALAEAADILKAEFDEGASDETTFGNAQNFMGNALGLSDSMTAMLEGSSNPRLVRAACNLVALEVDAHS